MKGHSLISKSSNLQISNSVAKERENMCKIAKTVAFACCCVLVPMFLQAERGSGWRQDCEQLTGIALQKLVSLVDKNDYTELETLLATIESGCGESEFTQRLRIFRALLEKQPTAELIADYLAKNRHETLIMRWDHSAEERYESIYRDNKQDFDYVPLRHPIDALLKAKAEALLRSMTFDLTEREEAIALLFADRIEAFLEIHERSSRPRKPTRAEVAQRRAAQKYRGGFSVYAGAEFPVTGIDPIFKTSPTMGFMYASPLESDVLFELGLKIRVNSNDRDFAYHLDGVTEVVNSSASYGIGGTLGRKLFDNDAFIIYPKLGIFFETTSTGLSYVSYYDDGSYEDAVSVVYNNVNTMRTSLGLAFMWHVTGKQYAGFEAAYHYIPYNWDSRLLTRIQPNYASLQVFFRF